MRTVGSILALLCAAAVASPQGAAGHEVRPAFLDLQETEANVFVMTWKVPARGAFRLGLAPRFPETCRFITEPTTFQTGDAFIERARVHCDHGLAGERLAIAGLEATQTDVLARIESRNGAVWTARLTPAAPEVAIAPPLSLFAVMRIYAGLGVKSYPVRHRSPAVRIVPAASGA